MQVLVRQAELGILWEKKPQKTHMCLEMKNSKLH